MGNPHHLPHSYLLNRLQISSNEALYSYLQQSKMVEVDKRLKKTFEKVGLIEEATQFEKITVRVQSSLSFDYEEPTVFISRSGYLRVIVGTPKIAQDDWMSQMAAHGMPNQVAAKETDTSALAPAPVGNDEVEVHDFEQEDVDVVSTQGNCSASVAVKALKETGGDVVEAIMKVTEDAA